MAGRGRSEGAVVPVPTSCPNFLSSSYLAFPPLVLIPKQTKRIHEQRVQNNVRTVAFQCDKTPSLPVHKKLKGLSEHGGANTSSCETQKSKCAVLATEQAVRRENVVYYQFTHAVQ